MSIVQTLKLKQYWTLLTCGSAANKTASQKKRQIKEDKADMIQEWTDLLFGVTQKRTES